VPPKIICRSLLCVWHILPDLGQQRARAIWFCDVGIAPRAIEHPAADDRPLAIVAGWLLWRSLDWPLVGDATIFRRIVASLRSSARRKVRATSPTPGPHRPPSSARSPPVRPRRPLIQPAMRTHAITSLGNATVRSPSTAGTCQ
jgi:hypothetical protein